MMRTNEQLVKGVLEAGGDYDKRKKPSLLPYIRAANILVNRLAARATDQTVSLSATEATEIETWVGAHCYLVSDQPYSSKSTGGASGSFQGQTGMYLEATKYGQTAIMLDPTGYLASLGKQAAVSVFHGGKMPAERTDYWDR